MSASLSIDLSEWEFVSTNKELPWPQWVIDEYCSAQPEPLMIHASSRDGLVQQWVLTDYLVKSV